jgi:hypothetical protein
MNISSCSNAYQPKVGGSFRPRFHDFKALGQALQSGDLAGAQTALDAFTKDIQNDPRLAKSGKSDQITKDLAALSDAIKTGSADDAKKAFATLTQDLKGLRQGHHHHKADNDGDADDAVSGGVPPPAPTAAAPLSITLNTTA